MIVSAAFSVQKKCYAVEEDRRTSFFSFEFLLFIPFKLHKAFLDQNRMMDDMIPLFFFSFDFLREKIKKEKKEEERAVKSGGN